LLASGLLITACAPVPAEPGLPGQPRLDLLDAPVRSQFEQAYRRAEEEIQAGVPADMALAIGELGMLYHAYAYPEPALHAYRSARELQENESRWHYLFGIVAIDLGMSADAESAMQAAYRLDPASGVIALRLGQIFFDRGQLSTARDWFAIALEDDRQTGHALASLAAVDLENGDPEAAIAGLSRARELMPNEVSILHAMGNAYRAQDQREKALRLFQEARSSAMLPQKGFIDDPFMQEILLMQRGHKRFDQLAASALGQGKADEALAHYRRALDAQPDALDVRHNLALLLWRRDRKDEARTEFEHIFSLSPAYAPSHLFLAFELGVSGDMEAAEEHILLALEADPLNLDAQLLLADFLDFSERSAEALLAYEKAIRLDPDLEKAWIGATYSLIRLNRHADADRMISSGLMRLPDSEQLAVLHQQMRELSNDESNN
jgi:tetratricopeptide (TPR) repeat protein